MRNRTVARNRTTWGIVLLALGVGPSACDSRSVLPSAPSTRAPATPQPVPVPVSSTGLSVFIEPATGFSTADLYDADDHIVQVDKGGELVWTPDGSRLGGYSVQGNSIAAELPCQCWLIVRFGTKNGERRAYLTADYGHWNPGTLVDLAIDRGVLVVNPTTTFVPGTYTLSGAISARTAAGPQPLGDAGVWRLNEERTGWQVAMTNRDGFYEMHGLSDGDREVDVIKDGYHTSMTVVTIHGDSRFNAEVIPR
jgi:hypothetical protein